MKRLLRLSAAFGLVLAASAAMLAQTQKDAHIGTGKLNVQNQNLTLGRGRIHPTVLLSSSISSSESF